MERHRFVEFSTRNHLTLSLCAWHGVFTFQYASTALCDQYYGLNVVKCPCLAYEFATKNNVNMPDNWARDGKAGVEWMMSIKSRHGLAIRQPEATSLARATAFNRYAVDQLYDNLVRLWQI